MKKLNVFRYRVQPLYMEVPPSTEANYFCGTRILHHCGQHQLLVLTGQYNIINCNILARRWTNKDDQLPRRFCHCSLGTSFLRSGGCQSIRSRTKMLTEGGMEQGRLKPGFGVRLDCQSIGAHLKIVEIIMDGPCHAEMDSQQKKKNCATNCIFVII
ncbi:unnamed protein product [Caenorhabditis nigoni]